MPCEQAVKLPLWDMSLDISALHKQQEALGAAARGKGLQRLVLGDSLLLANRGLQHRKIEGLLIPGRNSVQS